MAEKRCTKCGETKPLESFYDEKRSRDGKAARCKSCHDEGARAWKEANRDKLIAANRKRREKQREMIRARARRYREERAEVFVESNRRWRAKNPEKGRAHVHVRRAVERGQLVKPDRCETCGAVGGVHGHHEDYEKTLEVMWLCAVCHRRLHADRESHGLSEVR